MKSVRFSLDTALRWRETQLQQEEERLSRLFSELDQLELRRVENEKAKGSAFKSQLQGGSLPGSDFHALAAYLVGLDVATDRLRADVMQCRQKLEQQQAACIAAKRAVKLLDVLKEKRKKTWQYEIDLALEAAATESHLSRRAGHHRP